MIVLLPLLGFLFVSLLVMAAAMALAPSDAGVIERRLGEVGGQQVPVEEGVAYDQMVEALKKLGNAVPRSPSRCRSSTRTTCSCCFASTSAR